MQSVSVVKRSLELGKINIRNIRYVLHARITRIGTDQDFPGLIVIFHFQKKQCACMNKKEKEKKYQLRCEYKDRNTYI